MVRMMVRVKTKVRIRAWFRITFKLKVKFIVIPSSGRVSGGWSVYKVEGQVQDQAEQWSYSQNIRSRSGSRSASVNPGYFKGIVQDH